MADVVIFGAGDIARLAHFYFSRDSQHRVVGFTVDPEFCNAATFEGLPLVAFDRIEQAFPPASHSMFVALSYARMNQLRADKYEAAKQRGYTLATYVSSRCTYLAQDPPGENCFILEDNTVQPFVRIGSNVTLWSGNHIGHDSVIDDHVFISSHVVVSGHVRIGSHCFLGVNATLRNGITLAPRTLVGAGAAILVSTSEGSVHVTRPATRLGGTSDTFDL